MMGYDKLVMTHIDTSQRAHKKAFSLVLRRVAKNCQKLSAELAICLFETKNLKAYLQT